MCLEKGLINQSNFKINDGSKTCNVKYTFYALFFNVAFLIIMKCKLKN